MGYAFVPDIKDEKVVCQKPCQHRDCAANREMFSKNCNICGKPMLAGQPFYLDDNHNPQHAHCVWEQVEGRR
ncbi:MAG: hypothetical protein PHV74_00315 [Dehalococcoidia bacterium]|nr:hypothetical protein [Dehalococcoidia bacterium]